MRSAPSALRPARYQLVALSKLLLTDLGGVLVCDGVGVGKTISAGYIIKHCIDQRRANSLVVCPPGLVDKWRFELKTKFELTAHSIRNKEEWETAELEQRSHDFHPRVYVLPYSQLSLRPSFQIGALIVDEIHNFRNPATQGWRNLTELARPIPLHAGLSATPINNSEADLAALLAIVIPQYGKLVMDAIVADAWASHDLDLLSPVMTRFTKDQIGSGFVRRETVDVSVEYPGSYTARVRRLVQERSKTTESEEGYPLESITFYREAASSPVSFSKSIGEEVMVVPDAKLERLKGLLAEIPGRVLVFCQFTLTAEYLCKELDGRSTFLLTGDVPVLDREALIARFRETPNGILVLTAVGSEGLDLQFCDTLVNYDLHWNPMVLEQRIGRIDRIGQEKTRVRAFNFHVRGSIDDRIITVLADKLGRIAWTPLAVSPIPPETRGLFDERSLDKEFAQAEQLATTLELTGKIHFQDLPIAELVDLSACDPERLGKMKPLEWIIKEAPEWSVWSSSNSRNVTRLTELLERYSELIDSNEGTRRTGSNRA